MSKLEEYCFGESLNHDDLVCIRVCSGPYTGTIFSIIAIAVANEEMGEVSCDIDYELVVFDGKPQDKPDIEKLNADAIDYIVKDVIENALKAQMKLGE